jgi:hypothetical protein
LIHKAKTEEPKTEMQQLQTGLTGVLVDFLRANADIFA